MPFKSAAYQGIFTPEDLAAVQKAYNLCCEMLGRCPTTHEDKEQLARYVMRAFDQSKGDIELTAQLAANTVKMFE